MSIPIRQELKSTDQRIGDMRQANVQLEREVGESVQAQESVCDATLKYRIVADNTYNWVFWKAPSGEFLYVSPSCKRITGIDTSEFYKNPDLVRRIIHPDDLSIWDDHNCATLAEDEVSSMTFRIRHSDSSERWIEHTCQPVHDDQGKFLGVRGSNRDITDLRQAEELNRRLSEIIRHSVELVNLAELDGTMSFLNGAGGRMLGIDPQEVAQHNILEVIPAPLLDLVHAQLLPTVARGEVWEGDLQYRNIQTNECTDVHAICFAVKDSKTGRPLYLANVSQDITDRKEAEQELKIANEILEAKHVALREKNLALKNILEQVSSEKEELKTQIQSNVERVVLPTLRLLRQKVDLSTATYIDLLDSNLHDIASPLMNRLESNYASLSPGEIEICNMIQKGLSSQEMANLRNVSVQTISMQRKRIRRKLGIANQSVSLPSLLKSLTY